MEFTQYQLLYKILRKEEESDQEYGEQTLGVPHSSHVVCLHLYVVSSMLTVLTNKIQ